MTNSTNSASQNYRTISLISHSIKIMLKILLNRLKPQAEMIIAEEQAGFRPGRSTTEQIFNLRILCEKYLQHQQDLYHVFLNFKKAFDGIWHAALWATIGSDHNPCFEIAQGETCERRPPWFLKDKKRLRLRVIHLIEFIQSNNFHIYSIF